MNHLGGAEQITILLANLASGDDTARDRLFNAIYAELRQIAAAQLRMERRNHTLQPTALAHEACLRLIDRPGEWRNRQHLFHTAAKVMRQVLTDYARARCAEKRGGDRRAITLNEAINVPPSWSSLSVEDMIALNDALDRLKAKDSRQATMVELRFFVGLSEEEVAEILQVSSRTVKRDWEAARAWLFGELRGGATGR